MSEIPELRFGKYKGRAFNLVPDDYLRYLLKWDKLNDETRKEIEDYFKNRKE